MGGSQSAPQNLDDASERMRIQMIREAAILVGDQTCAVDVRNAVGETNMQELVDNIDQFVVKERLESKFYDAEFMRALGCALRLGLSVDAQLNGSKLIQSFFTDKKQIGAQSVEGVALIAGQQGLRDMFIIKAPKNPKNDNLIHEYFVAAGGVVTDLQGNQKIVIGTNWLRKVCLNYAQILGAFRCGPPDVDPLTKQVRSFCSTDIKSNYVGYVIYERIEGQDMKTMTSTISAVDFVSAMCQIAFALEIGQLYNGFTHYDLHSENIIMRDIGEISLIPYVLSEDVTVYIKSRYIPTFIDYGRCHIQSPAPAAELMGEPTSHFGFHAKFGGQYGIFPDRARPYYDLYKILGFTLYDMASNGNMAFEQVWPIMGFFGLRDINSVKAWLLKGRQATNLFSATDDLEKVGFCLKKTQVDNGEVCMTEQGVTMFDFLEYVENQFPTIWTQIVLASPIAGVRIMKCGDTCDTFEGALRDMTYDTNNAVVGQLSNFDNYKDIMRYRNNLNARGIHFRENFPESEYGPKLLAEVEKIDETIRQDYDNLYDNVTRQVAEKARLAVESYNIVGFPMKYTEISPTDPNIMRQELIDINQFLDRAGMFGKTYAEFKEYYEANEDMARIAGKPVSQELEDMMSKQIAPRYQAYDNFRGEVRRILEASPVVPELKFIKEQIWLKTM